MKFGKLAWPQSSQTLEPGQGKRRRKRDELREKLHIDPSYDRKRRATIRECLIYSKVMRISYVIAICFTIGFLAPYFINQEMQFSEPSHDVLGTCHITMGLRMNCFPHLTDSRAINQTSCESRGCCFQPLNLLYTGAPLCHRKIPSTHTMRILSSNATSATLAYSQPENLADWPKTTTKSQQQLFHYKLRQVQPGQLSFYLYQDGKDVSEADLGEDTQFEGISVEPSRPDQRLSLRVRRNDSTSPLLDLSYGSVIVSDSYSELSLVLPTDIAIGQGVGGLSFAQSSQVAFFNKTLLYNSDIEGRHHSHPIFMGMDAGHHFYGIFLETSGAPVEIEVMPGLDGGYKRPLIVYRVLSDFLLIHLFTGPQPKDVMRQLNNYLGRKSPETRLAFGYNLCRKVGEKFDSDRLTKDLKSMKDAKIPYDGDCISQSLMSSAFQTSSKLLANFAADYQKLSSNGKKFMLAQPPHTDVNLSEASTASFLKDQFNDSLNFEAEFENGIRVHMPDFEAENTTIWWSQQMSTLFQDVLKQQPDGLILVHNQPKLANGSYLCSVAEEEMSFVPGGSVVPMILGNQTICPLARHHNGRAHFKMHNNYGFGHARATNFSTAVFSHSSSPAKSDSNVGVIAGNYSTEWSELKRSLKDVLELSVAGVSLVSLSGCGSFASQNETKFLEELCTRWYQLAAFMPAFYSFYEDDQVSRLPFSFGDSSSRYIRYAIERRIKLMPYIMTQMKLANTNDGVPLIRPMVFEFPEESSVRSQPWLQWQQFMFGSSILVSPILEPAATSVDVYFPWGSWYELWSGINYSGAARWQKMEALLYQIPSYIRGGSIVPTLAFNADAGALSVEESYAMFDLAILVALECNFLDPRNRKGPNCRASGHLFEEDTGNLVSLGASMNETQGTFSIGTLEENCASKGGLIDTLVVYGSIKPSKIVIAGNNGNHANFTFDDDSQRLVVNQIGLDFCAQTSPLLLIEWFK